MSAIYKRLDSSRSEICVLALAPGDFNDPIRCTLSIVSPDGSPPAKIRSLISLVWGSPTGTRIVSVDDQPVLVTETSPPSLIFDRNPFYQTLQLFPRAEIIATAFYEMNKKEIYRRLNYGAARRSK